VASICPMWSVAAAISASRWVSSPPMISPDMRCTMVSLLRDVDVHGRTVKRHTLYLVL
jgi:hypothetical protein